MADQHKPFDYDIDEQFRRVVELAPVVPPAALARMAKETPLVQEANALIGNWYLFLSHMLYGEVKDKCNPGVLDEYLDRMERWLAEVQGVSFHKLNRIDNRPKPNVAPEDATDTH